LVRRAAPPLARELLVLNLVADGRVGEELTEAGKGTTPDLRRFVLALGEGEVASPREAREALEACVRERAASDAYVIARIYAWRRERDEAFSWLERALAQRDGTIWWIKCDPLLRKVRGDPRFAELLRRMNLPVE
jgi:serine/threonine-protein kinase